MTTLTPDSPVDLALRTVARQAAEHATAKEQDPSLQRLWANVANTATFLAKVARKLPPGMTARHLGLAVLVVQEQRSTDQPQRALHRLICRAIMTLLQESGAAVPGTQQDAARALHLWSILQALVMQQAAQTQAPQVVTPGVDPDQVLEQKQRGLMTLREMLLIDMIEMSGQMVMMLAPPAEVGEGGG